MVVQLYFYTSNTSNLVIRGAKVSIFSVTMVQTGLDPVYGDFEVLSLIFITECSPTGWLQSVLKNLKF
jgi:hypothetical protein